MKFLRPFRDWLVRLSGKRFRPRTTIPGVRRKPATIAFMGLFAAILQLFWFMILLCLWVCYGTVWLSCGFCWLVFYKPVAAFVRWLKYRRALNRTP